MELSLSSSDLSSSEESARERVMFIKSSSVIHPLLLDSSQHGFAMLTEARIDESAETDDAIAGP